MKTIEVGEIYRTRNGEKAEIIYKSKDSNKFPIVVLIEGKDLVLNLSEKGRLYGDFIASKYDIIKI